MEVTIKKVHSRSPPLLKDTFPFFVKIHGHHNQSTESADELNQLRVHPDTVEVFEKYFEQG